MQRCSFESNTYKKESEFPCGTTHVSHLRHSTCVRYANSHHTDVTGQTPTQEAQNFFESNILSKCKLPLFLPHSPPPLLFACVFCLLLLKCVMNVSGGGGGVKELFVEKTLWLRHLKRSCDGGTDGQACSFQPLLIANSDARVCPLRYFCFFWAHYFEFA